MLRWGKPIVILTGGEPLLREDIFELAKHGTDLGLRMVMATNGTLITPEIAKKNEVLRDSTGEHFPGRSGCIHSRPVQAGARRF